MLFSPFLMKIFLILFVSFLIVSAGFLMLSVDSLIVLADAIRKTTSKKGLLITQKEQKKWENLDFLGF